MAQVRKVLALYKNYNGRKDVLFMMKSDDPRLPGGFMYKAGEIEVLDDAPKFSNKEKVLETNQGTFRVFSDWSLAKL